MADRTAARSAAWWAATTGPQLLFMIALLLGGRVFTWEIVVWVLITVLWVHTARHHQKSAATWKRLYEQERGAARAGRGEAPDA